MPYKLANVLKFQSSPGPKAGRCRPPAPATDTSKVFQSSPGPKAGRCVPWVTDKETGEKVFQSSPGPKAGRCLVSSRVTRSEILFQSSPGPKAGRCLDDVGMLPQPELVSILARPEGRALLGRVVDHCHVAGEVSILARPEGRALPPRRGPLRLHTRGVSILARPEGRALPPVGRPRRASGTRFNPRPARRPGAALPSLRPRAGRL